MADDDPEYDLSPSLDTQVVEWRHEQLLHAGYPPELALELAMRTEIDLHVACDMLLHGCTAERAEAILT